MSRMTVDIHFLRHRAMAVYVTRGPKIKRRGEVGANVVNAQLRVEHSLELSKVPLILFTG